MEYNEDLMWKQFTEYHWMVSGVQGTPLAMYNYNTTYTKPKAYEYPLGMPPQVELSEAYKYFISQLASGRRFNLYYKQLLTLRRDILLDCMQRSQGLVARDLQLTPTQLSTLVQLFKEVDAVQYFVTNGNA